MCCEGDLGGPAAESWVHRLSVCLSGQLPTCLPACQTANMCPRLRVCRHSQVASEESLTARAAAPIEREHAEQHTCTPGTSTEAPLCLCLAHRTGPTPPLTASQRQLIQQWRTARRSSARPGLPIALLAAYANDATLPHKQGRTSWQDRAAAIRPSFLVRLCVHTHTRFIHLALPTAPVCIHNRPL